MHLIFILGIFGIFLLGEYLLPTNGIAFPSLVICAAVVQAGYLISLHAQKKEYGECVFVVILLLGCLDVGCEMIWNLSKNILGIPVWIIPFAVFTIFVAYRTDCFDKTIETPTV